MKNLCRTLPVLLLALTFAAAAAALPARSYAAQMSGQSSSEKIARGELVKVDTENMTLTVKDQDEKELEFSYDSDTKVEGSTGGVQGLSTKTGTRLTIHYKEPSEGKMLAVRIVIDKNTSRPK